MDWRRDGGLGHLRVLTDDIICRILSRRDMQEVGAMACVSSVFYIFCNDEPLWMRLCLESPSEKPMVYQGTWKQTALTRRAEELKLAPPCPCQPRRFEGFSSLHLYRQWYRCHVDLRTFSFDTGDVDRRSSMSPQEFASEYDDKKPALLTDLLGGWPACQEWTLPKLVERFGDVKFKVSQAHGRSVRMTMRNYAAYTHVQHDEEPLYIFDPTFGNTAPPLLRDYSVPPFFGDDFLGLLGGELKPPFRWLVLGPPRSGAAWHVDPNLTSAWNALVRGKKRWALYPPGKVPPGVTLRVSEDDGDLSFDGPPSLQWWLDVYPHIPPEERPLECTQLPGETIFVPGGWWHCVLNIEDSVAVTHNFVNEANLETVFGDLAPGYAHRGLARAGRLAQSRSVDVSPEQDPPSAADIAWGHFTDIGDDYISRPALRELLRRMWAMRPDLRERIWECACKTVGSEHWLRALSVVCKAHGMEPPGKEESLPLSGGRSAVFRVGGKVVKVFCGGELEGDKTRGSFGENGGSSNDGKVERNGTKHLQNGRKDGESEDMQRGAAKKRSDESEENGLARSFRTEVLLHELIRTSDSPLAQVVPAIAGHGVLLEEEDGRLVLEDAESAGTQPALVCGNGKMRKSGSGAAAVACSEGGKTKTMRRWMYVISAECKGTQLSDVYDELSEGDLLDLARFLNRQIGYIRALPLVTDEGHSSVSVQPSAKRQKLLSAAKSSLANGDRRRSQYPVPNGLPEDALAPPVLTSAAQPRKVSHKSSGLRSEEGPTSSPNGGRSQSHEAIGALASEGAGSESTPKIDVPSEVQCKPCQPDGAVSHSRAGSEGAIVGTPLATTSNGALSDTAADLPSLEVLGVPPKWRPFASFLRSQRKDLTERLTELGLPAPLLTSAEGYVPRDPVELLDFAGDPVWLHTDLLPDNILMVRQGGGESVREVGGVLDAENSLNGEKIGEAQNSGCTRGEGEGHGTCMDGAPNRETEGNEDGEKNRRRAETSSQYEVAHILDFADARTGDPLYEIASLHIGTFRGNPELLSAFLDASSDHSSGGFPGAPDRPPFKSAIHAAPQHSRSFRAMCFAMLHEINLLNMLARHWHGALSESVKWEQMSTVLFGELDKDH